MREEDKELSPRPRHSRKTNPRYKNCSSWRQLLENSGDEAAAFYDFRHQQTRDPSSASPGASLLLFYTLEAEVWGEAKAVLGN